jgi:hypothetical protein
MLLYIWVSEPVLLLRSFHSRLKEKEEVAGDFDCGVALMDSMKKRTWQNWQSPSPDFPTIPNAIISITDICFFLG